MSYNLAHTLKQAQNRGLSYTAEFLTDVSSRYQERVAVILGVRKAVEGVGREKIVLIVRNREPVTIMTRRESQTFDKRNFDVDKIVYL